METVQVIIYRKKADRPHEFLLLKRKKELGGFWQPVVGKVKPKEPLGKAFIRECHEEIGLDLDYIMMIAPEFYSFEMNEHHLTGKKIKPIKEHVFAIMVNADFVPDCTKNPDKEHISFDWFPFGGALQKLKWEDNKKALSLFFKFYIIGE